MRAVYVLVFFGGLGSALMGLTLRSRDVARLVSMAGLELLVGALGVVVLLPELRVVERLDATTYLGHETTAPLVTAVGLYGR